MERKNKVHTTQCSCCGSAYTLELEGRQTGFLFTEFDGVQNTEDIEKHMKVEETTFEKDGWKKIELSSKK